MILYALICAGLGLVFAVHAGEPPRLPIPVRDVELVLPRAVLGGREVSTARFTVTGDAPRAADAIAAAWRAAGAQEVMRRDSGPWQIVSRIAGGHVETVQIRTSGGGTSAGLISRWDRQPRTVSVAHHPRRLLPDDAALIDEVVSRDGGRVAVTAVALVDRGVATLAAEIAGRARGLGLNRESVIDAAASPEGAIDIAFYRRAHAGARGRPTEGSAELVVTLERRGGRTAAVVHLVEEEQR